MQMLIPAYILNGLAHNMQ